MTRNYEQHCMTLVCLGGTATRLRKQQDGNDRAHHVWTSAKNHKPGSEVGRGDGDHRREVTVNAGRRQKKKEERSARAYRGKAKAALGRDGGGAEAFIGAG